jgi:hypothetical protein
MNQASKYYEHSGAFGLMGPIYMIILGAVGTLVLSVIYGYAIFYIPFIYLNFFITLGFGAGVGFLVGLGGKFGKVRNSQLLLIFGLIFGLLAEYAGWVSWIFASSKQEFLVLYPSNIWSVIQIIAQKGAWGIFGWTPTGAALFIIWGIEAIMIIGASTLMSLGGVGSTPFCEHCNQWVEGKESISPLEPIANPDEFTSKLEQGGDAVIKALNKIEAADKAYTQIDLIKCPGCKHSNYLSIKSVEIQADSKGKEKKEEKDIIENFIISSDRYREIQQQW